MPVQVNLLEDGIGVEILGIGIVHGREIIEAHDEIYPPDHLAQQRYHIIDRSETTKYFVSAEEVKAIAARDIEVAKINPNIIMAIVSPNTGLRTIAELWQVQVEDVFTTKSFSNRRDADKWIAEQLS